MRLRRRQNPNCALSLLVILIMCIFCYGALRRIKTKQNNNFQVSRFEIRGKYQLEMFSYKGQSLRPEKKLICLGYHTSFDNLANLETILDNWNGTLSFAVFAPHRDFHLTRIFLRWFEQCHPGKMGNSAMHFLTPTSYPRVIFDVPDFEWDCASASRVLDDLRPFRQEVILEELPYPQNSLRNAAKRGCESEFSLVLDFDMVPSRETGRKLATFLNGEWVKSCTKCVFVVPSFEVEGAVMPGSKDELISLISEGRARPYQAKSYPVGQASTKLEQWLELRHSSVHLRLR